MLCYFCHIDLFLFDERFFRLVCWAPWYCIGFCSQQIHILCFYVYFIFVYLYLCICIVFVGWAPPWYCPSSAFCSQQIHAFCPLTESHRPWTENEQRICLQKIHFSLHHSIQCDKLEHFKTKTIPLNLKWLVNVFTTTM